MSKLSSDIDANLDETSRLLDNANTPSVIANDPILLNKAMVNYNRIIEIVSTSSELPDPTPDGICKL